MKILLVAINSKYIHSNLAVYSLKANAGECAQFVTIKEYTINNLKENILSDIFRFHADVLMFSTYIWNVSYVCDITREYKKISPDTPIWLGGPEVSHESETFLKEHPFITGIMSGEGEHSFSKLCAYYCGKDVNLKDICGLVYFEDGFVKRNPSESCIDLSTLEFSYDNLSDFENRIIYYESSRGCPFSCSYCLSSIDKSVRFRDLKLVLSELKVFLDNKVKQVKFVDRTFNIDHERTATIWKFIKDNDNGVTNFHFEIAADLLTESEIAIIKTMRNGLIQLEIGVQSCNEATIREIHRTMRLEKVADNVKVLKDCRNTKLHLDLIAGLPFEDYESFKASFDKIYALKPHELQLGFLKVLKGSYMFEHASDYGVVYTDTPPYEVLATKWITYDEILKLKLVEEMLEVYYNSGQFVTAVKMLEESFTSGFEMYYELGMYYSRLGLIGGSFTRLKRAEILLSFAQNGNISDCECLREALVYDIYRVENSKTRPCFADDYNEWKEKTHEVVTKGKLQHAERFHYDFLNGGGERLTQPLYLLFEYLQSGSEKVNIIRV